MDALGAALGALDVALLVLFEGKNHFKGLPALSESWSYGGIALRSGEGARAAVVLRSKHTI